MRRARARARALASILALAFALVAAAPGLAADCPPAEALLVPLRAAGRVQIEQLAGDDTRIETPLAHVPGRSLGYEVLGRYRVSAAVASALRHAFGRRDSYACAPGTPRAVFASPEALPIGVHFGEGTQAVTIVLHLPEGVAEIQVEGVPRASAPLSRAGQQRWELAIATLARSSRTTPDELYRQMTPPGRVPSDPAPPADSSSPPR